MRSKVRVFEQFRSDGGSSDSCISEGRLEFRICLSMRFSQLDNRLLDFRIEFFGPLASTL